MKPSRLIFPLLASAFFATSLHAASLNLQFRRQVETAEGSGRYHSIAAAGKWDPKKTCIVICDMWNDHYCRNAARRVAEMAPRMNEVIKAARKQGVLIIHCPSGCMNEYQDTPQRKLAQQAPPVKTKIKLESWCYLDPSAEAPMPVKVDQPCDDAGKLRDRIRFFERQIDALEIEEGDAITDSAEAYYLMKQRGITNVILMGVHVNMCVMGRPFGIRQMVRQGQNVVLMRDLTDSMYNPAEEPFVNHFTGNDLIFEHIERHWCSTITSDQILGDGAPFRFPGDRRKHAVVVMAEKLYQTDETLPPFALKELGRDFKLSFVYADATNRNRLPGVEIVKDADVIVLAARRRNLPKAQLELFRAHVAAGKPLVALRTSSHPFHQSKKPAPEGLGEWRDFDPAVLGGNYQGHHANDITTFAQVIGSAKDHPILKGVDARRFQTFGSLYKTSPLAKTAKPLLTGTARGVNQAEPVAWINEGPGGGRVFYTSLGHPYDFGTTQFRRLLRNAVYWAVGAESTDRGEDAENCCQ